jgi:hypothetical protein
MANTLRRKMFKLGGRANTHGVGITSGLKMKKGGRVEPQATFGVGNNALKKVGPEGKEREAHVAFLPTLGSILAPGLQSLIRLAPRLFSGSGRGSLGKFFTPKSLGRGPGGTRKTYKRGEMGRAPKDRIKTIRTPGAREGLKAVDFLRRAPRVGGAILGGGAGLGALSSVLPEFDDSPQDTLLENIIDAGRTGAETALNITGYLPATLLQAPFRKPEDIQGASGAIRSLIYGDKKDKVGSSLVDESKAAKTQKEQKDEFAGLSDKAERMAAAITKENNLATLAQAAGDFGAAASSGADLAQSLQAGTAGIYDELGRRRDLQENIGGMLAQQVFADEATQSAMIAEAAKTGDPAAVNRMQKYFDGYNEGVTNILPIDAKGKPDFALMAKGTVYMDLEGATGGRYFASNADGSDTKPFDSVEDANAFAQS